MSRRAKRVRWWLAFIVVVLYSLATEAVLESAGRASDVAVMGSVAAILFFRDFPSGARRRPSFQVHWGVYLAVLFFAAFSVFDNVWKKATWSWSDAALDWVIHVAVSIAGGWLLSWILPTDLSDDEPEPAASSSVPSQ